MKTNPLFLLPILGCFVFVSCYAVPDGPRGNRGQSDPRKDGTVTSEEQQKIQEQRDRMKESDEQKLAEEGKKEEIKEKPEDTTTPPDKPKEDTKKGDYAFANPVPGKEGFVFSPYNNKLVDVRDIPSGTLVRDPTYPDAEKKYFRVP
jgi:hypothetical protein